ncbi:MAG: BrnT family toxin [Sandaracinobacter sp.]|jgi:uncharacterized protein
MALSFDPAKRQKTLAERGLDFADAEAVLTGRVFEFVDARADYGEARITTIGLLRGRMVVVVWTQRGENQHIISMRKANDREQARYQTRLD